MLVPNLVRGVDDFIAGRVDVTTFAPGSGKVAEADAAVGIRYITLDTAPAAVAAMQKHFPTSYLAPVNPAPNLPGIRGPIQLMHFYYTVMANADLPADKVKQIAQILADNKDALAQALPLFRDFNAQNMYRKNDVPYHPGALAFYKERGIKESQ